jgi:hypothetical protein
LNVTRDFRNILATGHVYQRWCLVKIISNHVVVYWPSLCF